MTALSADQPETAAAADGHQRSERAAAHFVVIQIVALIFLQRLALHAGDGDIQLILPIMLASVAVYATSGGLRLDPWRFLAFAAFATAATLSQLFGGTTFSPTSLILLLIMYPALCFSAPVAGVTYLRCMNVFQLSILTIGAITLVMQAVQYTIGPGYWPNMDRLLPASIIIRGYNYLQPVSYGSPFFKPNAFFMVEVSPISQFCALALAVEIALFRRLAVIMFLGVVTLLTFAGTGLLILLFIAPLALFVLPGRTGVALALGVVVVAMAAYAFSWQNVILHRLDEFTEPGTSGYYRFNVPIQVFFEAAGKPEYLLHGAGAGSTIKGTVYLLLPFAKLISEYGLLTTVLFFLFLGISMFKRAPSIYIAYAALVQYTIGGSNLALPMGVSSLVILTTALRADRTEIVAALAQPRPGPWLRTLVRPV